jgi:hypothetical protein
MRTAKVWIINEIERINKRIEGCREALNNPNFEDDWDSIEATIDNLIGERTDLEFELYVLSKASAKVDAEWQREQAREAGMLHGIDAYNDMMGY